MRAVKGEKSVKETERGREFCVDIFICTTCMYQNVHRVRERWWLGIGLSAQAASPGVTQPYINDAGTPIRKMAATVVTNYTIGPGVRRKARECLYLNHPLRET